MYRSVGLRDERRRTQRGREAARLVEGLSWDGGIVPRAAGWTVQPAALSLRTLSLAASYTGVDVGADKEGKL